MRCKPWQWILLLYLSLCCACCSDESPGDECTNGDSCGPDRYCDDGVCRPVPADLDGGLRRDLPSPDTDEPAPDDLPSEPEFDTAGDVTSDCEPDCTGIQCGVDPVCGLPCGPPCPDAEGDDLGGVDPVDESTDALDNLLPECAEFCRALCEFLLECGKEDPTCLVRCGQSTRYQQLSSEACEEGTHVIGLEECRLWLDCGGESCAIDEMCLEVYPGVWYECAPICDLSQSLPACPSGDECKIVQDAAGSIMSVLGICWSLL